MLPHSPCWPHPGPFGSNIFSLSHFPPGSQVARATYSLSFLVAHRARAHARAFVWMLLPPRGSSPGSHSGSHFALFRPARAFVTVLQVVARAVTAATWLPSRTSVSTSHPALLCGGVSCLHLASPYVPGSNASGLSVVFSALLVRSTLAVFSASTDAVFGPYPVASALVLPCPKGSCQYSRSCMQAQDDQRFSGLPRRSESRIVNTPP